MIKKIFSFILITCMLQTLQAQTDLGATSQASSNNLSDGTSQGTTNAQASTTIVVVGGIILVVGIPLSIISTVIKSKEKEQEKVAIFMRHNHNELIHDVTLGSGAILNQLGFELGLDKQELKKIETRLARSKEQKEILRSLDGQIDNNDALVFSQNLSRVFLDALGKNRVIEVVKKAWGEK